MSSIELGPLILLPFHIFLKQVISGLFTFYSTPKVYTPCPNRISFFPLAQSVDYRSFRGLRSTGFGGSTEDLDKLNFPSPPANRHRMIAV
jgi:hypothetical protein